MEDMHVVFATDDAWAAYAGAAILSTRSSSPPDERFVFHVLTLGLSDENVLTFAALEHKIQCPIKVHVVNGVADRLPSANHYGNTANLRLFVSEILVDVNKIIYLDSDILVLRSFREIYDLDLTGRAAAVVLDQLYVQRSSMQMYHQALGLLAPETYFNSGVMVINLSYWREKMIGEAALEWLARAGTGARFPDQDALNVVLQGQVRLIPSRWNLTSSLVSALLYKGRLANAFRDEMMNVAVVHFTGGRKPWKRELRVPYATEFRRYLQKTPWAEKASSVITLKMIWTRVLEEVAHIKRRLRSGIKWIFRVGAVYQNTTTTKYS